MQGPARTRLLVIGGAEDKVGPARVLRRFVRLAGGPQARIVVLPTASMVEDEMVQTYRAAFERIGVADVTAVQPTSRADANSDALVRQVVAATGIFMTGGNQLKLAQLVVGTALGDAIVEAHQRGVVVAGTSAGASIMSAYMIALGEEGITPRQRASQLSAGLGLLPGVIVDQHFDQRARYGRLLSMVALSPHLIGMGIDENTAALVTDGRRVEVIGAGAVFVVDAARAVTNAADAPEGAPVLVSGATVHTLPTGARFDLKERALEKFTPRRVDPAVAALPGGARRR